MSSEKLQDLFYMVLMAGNFLNSVSVRRRSTGGHIYGVRGCEDQDVTLKTYECSFEPLCMVAYRESLKGSSQAVRICGGNIAFSCLPKVNQTPLSHLISHNLGRAS